MSTQAPKPAYCAERLSPTEWLVSIDCGGTWSTTANVVVVAEGIKVDYQLITWDELADARQFFTMKQKPEDWK